MKPGERSRLADSFPDAEIVSHENASAPGTCGVNLLNDQRVVRQELTTGTGDRLIEVEGEMLLVPSVFARLPKSHLTPSLSSSRILSKSSGVR